MRNLRIDYTEYDDEKEIQIVMPRGMLGSNKDYLIDSIIRAIAEVHGKKNEWSDKYGSDIDNNVFMMHPYCWCEREACPWCREDNPLPNFHYKPIDFKVSWYKYIGRSYEFNKPISIKEATKMLSDCINFKNLKF